MIVDWLAGQQCPEVQRGYEQFEHYARIEVGGDFPQCLALSIMAPARFVRVKGLGPRASEPVGVRGANAPDALPHYERRLDAEVEYRYGRMLADVSPGWRPIRTWAAVRSTGTQRLIGVVPPELARKEDIGFEDLRGHIEHLLGIQIGDVNWFSTYRVQHRVAERFRSGRVFIAGDAGHIHSPAGGQGMNTGIGDAVNLSRKIAEVLRGRADSSLLDTYEAERIPFAHSQIATTDRVFQFLVDDGKPAQVARVHLLPRIVGTLAKFSASRRKMFKTVSQVRISYRDCELNSGKAGAIHGGDRLPWIVTADGDNFEPLHSLDWQLHVYGDPTPRLIATADQLGLPIQRFPWSGTAEQAGVRRDAAYLVRPDGYVAVAVESANAVDDLTAWVGRWGLRFGEPAQPEKSA